MVFELLIGVCGEKDTVYFPGVYFDRNGARCKWVLKPCTDKGWLSRWPSRRMVLHMRWVLGICGYFK